METEQKQKVLDKRQQPKKEEYSIVRIMQTDIPGNKKVFVGLTYIKGVSWSISNALCKIINIDFNKKISELTKPEIEKITKFLESPQIPKFLMNRRNDFETGENSHLVTTNLDMSKEFDIRRLKKIRSYRGLRHALGLPSRGQRTRSNFRKKGKSVGVQRRTGAKKK